MRITRTDIRRLISLARQVAGLLCLVLLGLAPAGLVAGERLFVGSQNGPAAVGHGAIWPFDGKTGAFIDVFAQVPGMVPKGLAFVPDSASAR